MRNMITVWLKFIYFSTTRHYPNLPERKTQKTIFKFSGGRATDGERKRETRTGSVH